MILVFSDRQFFPGKLGVDQFGSSGSDTTLLLAQAEPARTSAEWSVEVVGSPKMSWMDSPEACDFLKVVFSAKPGTADFDHLIFDDNGRTFRWIFYVPGYNSTLDKGLKRARQLQDLYQANVILYSWPANPPNVTENFGLGPYRTSQGHAERSAPLLAKALSALSSLQSTGVARASTSTPSVRLTLLCHSLGNYLFEHCVRGLQGGMPRLFENVILHQPDITPALLPEWAHRVEFSGHFYLTLSKFDGILRLSEIANGVRAGQSRETVGALESLVLVDFTYGRNIADSHFMFDDIENDVVDLACARMIKGVPDGQLFNFSLDGRNAFTYYEDDNLYVLSDPSLDR